MPIERISIAMILLFRTCLYDVLALAGSSSGRVEMWRGGLGAPYLFPALSSAGASLGSPCSVSTSRSSNRTGGSPASGSRRRLTLSPTESCVSVCLDERDPRLHRDVYPETSRLHVLRACVSFATIDAASSSRSHLQHDRLY